MESNTAQDAEFKEIEPKHNVVDPIIKALTILETQGDSKEDARAKAIVKTKLEEALLWSGCIYKPIKLNADNNTNNPV